MRLQACLMKHMKALSNHNPVLCRRLVCVHLLLADSTFGGYRLALIDHLDKQLLPILCCLDL